jgi:nucleoside-diphosphate-sugar epimerase
VSSAADPLSRSPRCLVAGGCGFIGHRVVRFLRQLGWTVEVIDNRTDYGCYDRTLHAQNHKARESALSGTIVHETSILNHAAVMQVFEAFKPEVVVHLASIPIARIAASQPIATTQELCVGTASLLEASRVTQVKRYVYVSSSMTYGDFEQDQIPETHPQRPKEPYGALKLACEHLVRSYTMVHSLEHAIVRPTAVYGPTGNEAFVLTRFVRAARCGGVVRVNGPDTRLDFTYVDDAARGIVLASMSPNATNQTFNISAGQARTLMESIDILQRLAPGLRVEVAPPDPLYPRRGALSIEKARRLMGFEPMYSLERGLEEFFESV